jgi:hypothetical protein
MHPIEFHIILAMAGVTWWNFYFRLFVGTIRSPQVIEFLAHLLRHVPGKLLIVWNGLRHPPQLHGVGVRSAATWAAMAGVSPPPTRRS